MRNEENICQYCTRQRAITTLSLNACLNQMYQELLLTNCIELGEYDLKLKKKKKKLLVLTLRGYISKHSTAIYFPHISLNILYSVHLFGIQWSFPINLFSNVLFQTSDYFRKHIPNKLLISLY